MLFFFFFLSSWNALVFFQLMWEHRCALWLVLSTLFHSLFFFFFAVVIVVVASICVNRFLVCFFFFSACMLLFFFSFRRDLLGFLIGFFLSVYFPKPSGLELSIRLSWEASSEPSCSTVFFDLSWSFFFFPDSFKISSLAHSQRHFIFLLCVLASFTACFPFSLHSLFATLSFVTLSSHDGVTHLQRSKEARRKKKRESRYIITERKKQVNGSDTSI